MFIFMLKIDITKKPASDWDSADIKYALEKKSWTLAGLSRHHNYCRSAVNKTIENPWPKMERFIADAIGVKPQEIWPSRYTKDGKPNRPMGRKPSTVNSTSTPDGCNVNKQKGIRYGT